MSDNKNVFNLTDEDKLRYEEKITREPLPMSENLILQVAKKLESLVQSNELTAFQISLLEDLGKLLTLLRDVPDLDDNLKHRISFAFRYFLKTDDEIPDTIPDIGYMDDAIVVRWVVDQIFVEYQEHFEA